MGLCTVLLYWRVTYLENINWIILLWGLWQNSRWTTGLFQIRPYWKSCLSEKSLESRVNLEIGVNLFGAKTKSRMVVLSVLWAQAFSLAHIWFWHCRFSWFIALAWWEDPGVSGGRFFFNFKLFFNFIYLWLRWVFIAAPAFSGESRGYSNCSSWASPCLGCSHWWA